MRHHRSTASFALSVLVVMGLVRTAAAAPPDLAPPDGPGPFNVGVTTFFAEMSAARVTQIRVWYPTAETAGGPTTYTIVTAVGQEQADARYTMTDDFLFGLGLSYATVRCAAEAIGTSSPISDPTRPWSDELLDTSSEFITSAGDEFDIFVDYVTALRTDPIALSILGPIERRAAFGYSASGCRVRGLLRLQMGVGLLFLHTLKKGSFQK